MADELIVQRESPVRIQLEASRLDDEDLLHGVDVFAQRPCGLLLHVEIGACGRIDLADLFQATAFINDFVFFAFAVRSFTFGRGCFASSVGARRLFSCRGSLGAFLCPSISSGKTAEGCYEEPDASCFHRFLFRFPLHTTACQESATIWNYSIIPPSRNAGALYHAKIHTINKQFWKSIGLLAE
jgi:hypothetical protein